MKKRTEQIDDDREVLLPGTINGKQLWKKAGSDKRTPEEADQFSQNLVNHQWRAQIQKMVTKIMTNAQLFAQQATMKLAPAHVVEAVHTMNDPKADWLHVSRAKTTFASWIDETGYAVVQDGLKTLVMVKGKVVAELVAEVGVAFENDVVAEIKRVTGGGTPS